MPDRLAAQIPGLQVLGELGRGARSVLYRARRGDFVVALKLPSVGREELALLRQFRREAVTLASVAHPCLPQVYEVGEADGLPYVIRELAEGPSLASQLVLGPLPEVEVAGLGRQLAQALAAIHRRRLVHREVAPHNVLWLGEGLVKLVDFGAPRPGEAHAYHAPEQTGLLERAVDGRADLYALGALLFHAAAGRPPFVAADPGEQLRQHAVTPAPPLASLRPGCSPVLADILARLLAKDPDDRYQTGEAVAAALAPLLGLPPEPVLEDRPAAALVGRAGELQQLTTAWQQVRRAAERGGLPEGTGGATPVIATIEGEPGAGKSRLVAEFIARVAGPSAAVVLHSRCSDDALPFAAVREALEGVARRASADSAVARELAARLRAALGELAGLLRGLAPGLAALVAGPTYAEDDGAVTREQVDGAVVDGLARLTAVGGLVWVVDDLQWIDEGSLQLLRRLATRQLEGPALLLCCMRAEPGEITLASVTMPSNPGRRPKSGPLPAANRSPRGRAAWARLAEALPPSLHLRLGPLPLPAVGQLMAGLLGERRAPQELVELVARRTDGLPLAVLELVWVMLDEGVLRPSWDVWVADAAGVAALPLGGDALRLISTRIEQLSPETGEVLRLAGVCGDRFELALLARAGNLPISAVEAAVEEAGAAGLVEPGRGGGHSFVHHRVREAVLASLGVEERQALHQAVAEALGPGGEVYARAHHFLAGELRDPGPARAACLAAGLHALAEAADEDAHRLLTRARELPGAADDPALVDALAEASLRTGRLAEAEEHIERGLRSSVGARRAGLLRRRARVALLALDHARALATMDDALGAVGERLPGHRRGDAIVSAWAWLLAMIVGATGLGRGTLRGPAREHASLVARCLADAYVMAYFAMDRRTMVQAVLRHFYLAERLGPSPELALAHSNYATLLVSLGYRRRGLQHARAAEALAQRLGEPTLARVHQRLTVVYEFAGEPRLSEALGRQVVEHERRWLDSWGQVTVCEVLAFNLWIRGRDGAALAAVQPMIVELQTRGPGLAGQQALVLLQATAGLALTGLGRTVEAEALFEAAHRGCVPDDPYQNAVLHTCDVIRAVDQGELGAPLEDAIVRHAQLGLGERRIPFYGRFYFPFVAFARLIQAIGCDAAQRGPALARLTTAIAEAERRPPHPLHRGFLLLARAGLQWLRGDCAGALETLGQAEDLALKTDNHWLRFEVLRQQAHALRAAGHLEAGLREARLALALAEQQRWPLRALALQREFELGAPLAGRGDVQALKLRRHLDALLALSLAAARSRGFDEQARAAIEELTRILPAERTALFLGREGDALVMVAGRDAQGRELAPDLEVDRGVLEQVRTSRAPVLARGDRDRRSVLAAPLLLKDALIGVVYLDNRTIRGAFTGDDVDILQAVAGHLAIALETARTTQLEAQVVASVHEKSALIEHATSAVGIGIAVLQADGKLAQVSPTLREMTRAWSSAEAWWRAASAQLLLPEPTPCPRCGEAQDLGRSVADLRHGGERQVFEVTFTGHFHEFTRAEAGHVLLVSDITRRKISEENLLRLNEELTHARDAALGASRAKSTFLANMSHELRTPLNAIIGFAEMLVEDAEQLGARHMVADLGKIRMSGTHLLELISTILDLSKVETGRMELEILEFSLAGLVERVATMLRPTVAKNRNMLSYHVADGCDRMIGDETKVRQILFNLLSNAAKFTRDGVVKLEAHGVHEDGRDWVICTVSDTGIGFRGDQIDKLFQDFYQADMSTTRKYGGTGLGLAIVYRFCKLMEGEVTVTSEPDIGSSFIVKLPRVLTRPVRPLEAP